VSGKEKTMDNLARVLNREETSLEYGTVRLAQGKTLMVETRSGVRPARRALSCLLEPRPGDTVLVSETPSADCYVLSILERPQEGPATLCFDGDVELKAASGRVRVAAQEGIDLVSARDTQLVSSSLSVSTLEAEVTAQQLSFFGTLFQGQVDRIKLAGQTCDSVFDRVSQTARRSYRRIEELEHVAAGQLTCLVKKLLSLRGKHSVLTAEEDVRIDGDKILMG
jgi:hypothetical protein